MDLISYSQQSLSEPKIFTSARGVSIEGIIQAWLHSKNGRSQSIKTHTAYEDTIKAFRSLLQSKGYDLIWEGKDFMSMVADFAQAFAAMRSEKSCSEKPVSSSTIAQRLAILSSFYHYAIKREHLLSGNPIDSVDRPSVEAYAQAQAIPQQDLAESLKTIDISTLQGARDLAILSILLSTGRRVSEVSALTRKDLQISGEQIKLSFQAKGGKAMRDTLSQEVSIILGKWLSTFYSSSFMSLPDDTPVWVNLQHTRHRGEKLGYHGFSEICKHYLGTSKVHATRHSFALLMEVAGAKLTDIQQRLGHKNAATTGIYLDKLTQDKNAYAGKIAELLGLK